MKHDSNHFSRTQGAGRIGLHATGVAALAIFMVLIAGVGTPGLAQTESLVYSFANPPDAYGPKCPLVVDAAGNMYGTSFSGGAHNLGAVFKVEPSGTETVVYSFAGGTTDGSHPVAGLFRDKRTGILYGTTVYGGAANNGTVFVFNPTTGIEKVLYSFKGGQDGANPYAAVVRSGTTIFGTTYNGGAFGYGTVFKVTATGKETVLHSFNSAFPTLDGSYPLGDLTIYKGILYGTTSLGGLGNQGTVFSIRKTGLYKSLYTFKGGPNDGQYPNVGVTFDQSGNIYGTTYGGGADNAGIVFKLAAGAESVLHNFARDGVDGINPNAGLVLVNGDLYGTTLAGGSSNGGTVFKITTGGTETLLHDFDGGTTDGFNPYAALVLGANNALYGTTLEGGLSSNGTVFKLVP